jgi:Zn-dependent protease with chaperone function
VRETLMIRASHPLAPLPYHAQLRDYVKQHEPELWQWFASASAQADYARQLRLDLLKSTYRLDPESHPDLYQATDAARTQLGLDIPVTVYQAPQATQPNAALFYLPGEGHLVFAGPALTLLDQQELVSVIGHELAHYQLWSLDEGEFHVTDRLIHAVAADPRASSSHVQSARRFQLYTEIFADRGSLQVTGDVRSVVSGLVKMQTGLTHVSADSYMKQADEVFSASTVRSEGRSHPEDFIRARALALWAEQADAATPHITAMIEGGATLDELDLLGQARLTRATRELLEYFLQPRWLQTDSTLGHARLFFPDFQPAVRRDPATLDGLRFSEPSLRNYISALLTDFARADPDLDEMPLAAAFDLSRQLEMDDLFEKLVTKELKIKTRDLKRLKERAADMLAAADAS